jgi:hypothetical protein
MIKPPSSFDRKVSGETQIKAFYAYEFIVLVLITLGLVSLSLIAFVNGNTGPGFYLLALSLPFGFFGFCYLRRLRRDE